jgi:hypothetical protein
LRVRVLPQHPYSLELFTERRSPLVEGRISSTYRPVYYDRGITFRYKQRRSSLTLSYLENISQYGKVTVDSVSQTADASYGIGPFINSGGYRVTDTATSPNKGTTTQILSYYDNTLYFKDASFTSRIDSHQLVQKDPRSIITFSDATFTWKEQASITLPWWDIQTNGAYALDEDTVTQKDTSPAGESAFSREAEFSDLSISKRFYNSLSGNFYINNINSHSTGGEMKTKSKAFNVNYVKMIPGGRFMAGYFSRRSVNDIINSPTVTNEKHTIAVSGACNPNIDTCFDLNNTSIDVNSIMIWVESPPPLNDLILLTNADYTVYPVGNKTEIAISPAALTALGFTFPGSFNFYVKYSFIQQTVEYETNNLGYNIKFELFNNLLNPYYGFSKQEQIVLSGSMPGGPQNTETETIGVLVMKLPYTFTEEYQSISSNVNPSKTFRSIADYRKNIAPDTSLYARLHYTSTTTLGENAYSDNTLGADARLQKFVPQKHLSLGLNASFAHRSSFSSSDMYLLHASVMWSIGNLIVNATASTSETVSTSGTMGKSVMVSQEYFLTMTRQLF